MNVDRNITYFCKIGKTLELCDFKIEIAFEFLLQLGNNKLQRSNFDIVCYARQIRALSDHIIAECIYGPKRRNYHFSKCCVSFAFKYKCKEMYFPKQWFNLQKNDPLLLII